MVFVGDYIYEGAGRAGDVRRHVGGETRTLADYRNRHAHTRPTGPAALARRGALVGHLGRSRGRQQLRGQRRRGTRPDFRARRAAAYQAYYEHMPLRARARPTRSGVVLRARQDFGRLARFHVLDGRQRRTPQACPARGRGGARMIDGRCRELRDPARTMLGATQEAWLARGMSTTAERWNFIAQQTLMARAASWWTGGGASRRIRGTGIPRHATDCSTRSSRTGWKAAWCSAAMHTPRSHAISSATSAIDARSRSRPNSAGRRSRPVDGHRQRSTRSCEITLTCTSETAGTGASSSSTSPPTAAWSSCGRSRTRPTAVPASPPQRPSESTPASPARNASEFSCTRSDLQRAGTRKRTSLRQPAGLDLRAGRRAPAGGALAPAKGDVRTVVA